MIALTIDLDASDLDWRLDSLARGVSPPLAPPVRRAVRSAADQFDRFSHVRFLGNGNGTWAPLRPSTIRKKRKAGTLNKGTLRASDRLLQSLSQGSADHVDRELPDGYARGTTVPYSIYHQLGTRRMPARTVYGDPDAPTLALMMDDLADGVRALAEQG